ncbi:methyltransferase family protein [Georgenia soli]|uniref:Methyltransferase family protein n=1 Tax=Georgenia soli TaxID=638953 RepID=A0A2A9F2W8_9MICO|nr:class I SAM-dependent methyltransferase [Georgenia soli]PFG44902.1 methyltransferase family protein [Georgenia soli]
MLMNSVETIAVNNPARRALQRYYEMAVLTRLGGRVGGGRVLEIGCGSGYGTKLILDRMGAATVDAVDADPAMVARARRRLQRYNDAVWVECGEAHDLRAVLGAQDATYDAVFDFAALHHIENWRSVLAETARVLRPGGRFYFVEVTSAALARPSYRLLFDHPEQDRFGAGQFLAELHHHGLDPAERWKTAIGSDYLLGVAERLT